MRRFFHCATTLLLGAAVCVGARARALADTAPSPRITVALTGQPVPGAGAGVDFGPTMQQPLLSRSGQLTFATKLQGAVTAGVDDDAVLRVDVASGVTHVLRTGQTVPGMPGTSDILRTTNITGAGTVVIHGVQTGPGVSSPGNEFVALWSGGSPQVVARGGDAPPGATGNEYWGAFGSVVINEAGKLALTAALGYPPGGRNDRPQAGIWAGQPGALAQVARNTDAAPGMPGVQWDRPFRNFGAFDYFPVISAAGDVVFATDLYGSITPNPSNSIWADRSTGPQMLVRQGGPAPEVGAGATLGMFNCNGVYLNDAGQYALNASYRFAPPQVGGPAIWLGDANRLRLVAKRGDPAPVAQPGLSFASFDGCPTISGNGLIGFSATLTGTGVNEQNDSAIFLAAPGQIRALAREGDAAPDLSAGVRFGRLNYYIDAAVNIQGQAAFLAELAGTGVTDANKVALFATDGAGTLHLLARTGPGFEVAPGDVRTVKEIFFTYGNGQGGYTGGFNDLGQLVYGISFSNGTSAIFLATVPEPGIGCTPLLLLACAAAPRRALRRHAGR